MNSIREVERILGIETDETLSVSSEMFYYSLSSRGVPKKALKSMAEAMNLSVSRLSLLLPVGERTLQRKKDDELLSADVSDHVLQFAEVFARGREVFGSDEKNRDWFNCENRALGLKKPLDILSSSYGVRMVLDLLGRIEHGVFS